MNPAPQVRGVDGTRAALHVTFQGVGYPAEELARGAAYRLLSRSEAGGFHRHPDPGAGWAWQKFVHATEVDAVHGATVGEAAEAPLTAPLSRFRGWSQIQAQSQSGAYRDDPGLAAIRRTATVRRGTRMMKVVSAAQAAGHLQGWLPSGFCYREYDIAHLRTPADLALLRTDTAGARDVADVAFALRWRAVDPVDYEIPFGTSHGGLCAMPPHDRVGPPVIGSGFAPSEQRLIPEFVTAGLSDLPLPANAQLLAYTADGEEVVLFSFQPEQRGWLRMAGPRWRRLLTVLPGVSADREYLPVAEGPRASVLVGRLGEQEVAAVADPPDEFRALAMSRAARYPVQALLRRGEYAEWRGAYGQVLRRDAGWARLRLCRPDADSVAALGASCYERGIYEAWAPAGELTGGRTVDVEYQL